MSDERIFIGLGANLGDAAQTLQQAVADIAGLPDTRLIAQSSLYASAPVDAQGPDFINAVLELRSPLSPQALLRALQGVEQSHGRQRPYRNAPRTLDLDILLYGDQQVNTPELTLPHPRLHQRAFVLLPLLELDAALQHPQLGALAAHAAAITDQTIRRLP